MLFLYIDAYLGLEEPIVEIFGAIVREKLEDL